MATSIIKQVIKKATSELCPDCAPAAGCLTCDNFELISTDSTVKLNKTQKNGKCAWNLRVNATASPFLKGDTQTISLEGDSRTTQLKANVRISATAGNILTQDSGGLLVLPGALTETPNAPVDSPTIDITLSGTSSRQIRADLKISALANQAITVEADGIHVSSLAANSGDWVFFVVGDSGFPDVGENTYVDNTMTGRKVVVFRNGFLQRPVNTGTGDTWISKPTGSNTLTFSAALGENEDVLIIIL